MSENILAQKQYDQRLRCLIQTTDDLDLAVRHGVPRSAQQSALSYAVSVGWFIWNQSSGFAPQNLRDHPVGADSAQSNR